MKLTEAPLHSTSIISITTTNRPHQHKMRNTDLLSHQMAALGLQNTTKDTHTSFCVTADLLIPGRGKPIPNACIIVKDTRITHVGPAKDVLAHYSELPKTHVKVLMPGMWDCHVHLVGIHKIASDAFVQSVQSPVLSGARTARDCMLLLNAGFTSVSVTLDVGLCLGADQMFR